MASLREHVHRLDFFRFIAAVFQDAEVAGECRQVAADVDEAFRAVLQDGPEKILVAAFSGRVDDEDVEPFAFLVPTRNDVFCCSGFEPSICEAVDFGVALGFFDRLRDNFDGVDFIRLLGEEE